MWKKIRRTNTKWSSSVEQPMEHDSFPNCDKDIIEACSFKGAVDPRLRSAMESGSIVEDTRAMAARDVMHQWSSRTRDAKTKAVETFRAYLRATNRDNIFFPANGQQTSSKEAGHWAIKHMVSIGVMLASLSTLPSIELMQPSPPSS